jgi:transmembrane sensor
LLLVTGAAYQYLPVSYESIANASTRTRSLDLPDGTRIHANVGTRVSVRYTLAERRIDVAGGEVYIDAASDRRPLVVTAGGAELRDIGTEFNVLLLPDTLQVGVRSGQVMLDASGADGPKEHTLRAGDTVLLSRAGGRLLGRQQVPPGEIGAWQDGVAVVHDATLQQLAGYLALYRDAPVRFADARARGLRLSGTLDLRHPEAFLDTLPGLLPVTLTRRPDGSAVIASR